MTFIMTLVGAEAPPDGALLDAVVKTLTEADCSPGTPTCLEPEVAEIALERHPLALTVRAMRDLLQPGRIDLFITPMRNRRKKLLVADMDATIVTSETLDELAAHASLQERIAAITARAMAGELDFHDSLRERVGLLKGLGEEALRETLSHTTLSKGAAVLVNTMARQGATCVLVSGGFTFFTGEIAARAGFHYHHGNALGIEGGALTGLVAEPILDKDAKLAFLRDYTTRLNLAPDQVFAIGDGANDLPMLQAAGLGIGYRPKPLLLATLANCIIHGDLTAALYAQGYRKTEFYTA